VTPIDAPVDARLAEIPVGEPPETPGGPAAPPGPPAAEPPAVPPLLSFALIAVVGALILYLVPRPATVTPQGWRMLAIFVCTVLALMLRPVPGGAAVLTGVLVTMLTNTLTPAQALAGYGNTTVWLVIAAFLYSRAVVSSGLARRFAYWLIRTIGHTTLGLGYSLVACDVVMATVIPGNSSRIGGVLMPIARTLSSIYGSKPGATAKRIGSYLMLTVYQGDTLACAMYLTGQASNPIAAGLALKSFGIDMSWSRWLIVASVPAAVSFLLIPWLVYKLNPPEVTHTPEAREMARAELAALGPMTGAEYRVIGVLLTVCLLWATASLNGLATVTVALMGVIGLLATRTLHWAEIVREHTAWDVFLWFGGIIRMGEALAEFKVTDAFAATASAAFGGWTWPILMIAIVLRYFYVHYFFASVTTHIVSMFLPFASLLVAAGAPAGRAVFSLAIFANLAAVLTHYGTTPGPILYSQGYVATGRWWKAGFITSLAYFAVWGTVGLAWWKVLHLW
jgi:DASS family divalent anion:Na+ symporter